MHTQAIISKDELLQHLLAHRGLTRKTIEKFPEKDLFGFQIGGMRPFAELVKELLAIAGPGLKAIATQKQEAFNNNLELSSKDQLLEKWAEADKDVATYFNQIPEAHFHEKFKLFGQYELSVIHHVLYFIDNEIHHRGQGFVYLRALGIEPPFFWDRY